MIVASTMVPVEMRRPLRASNGSPCPKSGRTLHAAPAGDGSEGSWSRRGLRHGPAGVPADRSSSVGWEIHARKTTLHRRLVEGFLGAGIGEIEPLLQEVDAQHDRLPNRLTAVARLGIARPDQCFQITPRNHHSHHAQKLFTAALPCILLKTCLARQSHLTHHVPHPHSTLFNLNAGEELKQRIL